MQDQHIHKYKILVIDDDASIVNLIERLCARFGFLEFHGFVSPVKARSWAKKNHYDFALIDYMMPLQSGTELARHLLRDKPESYVLLMTAHAEIGAVIEAIRAGVFDFIVKPFDLTEFTRAINRVKRHLDIARENRELTKFLRLSSGKVSMIGQSSKIKDVIEKIKLFAKSDAPVLVTGETGVGKEIASRMIHQLSARGPTHFVAVNCSAYAQTLLENELFGHERGAFTGADTKRIGRFEFAEKGTILLDEVCEIPLTVQVKLLRVLQEKQFERVGGNDSIELKARIISCANKDIDELISKGVFRQDLYYRLNTLSVDIPPLRERIDDIKTLAKYFLSKFSVTYDKNISSFEDNVIETFEKYYWPGNIRQLENVVDYAVLSCQKERINEASLPWEVTDRRVVEHEVSPKRRQSDLDPDSIPSVVKKLEIKRISDSLLRNRWNKSRTALELGLTRRQLTYRIDKYGID